MNLVTAGSTKSRHLVLSCPSFHICEVSNIVDLDTKAFNNKNFEHVRVELRSCEQVEIGQKITAPQISLFESRIFQHTKMYFYLFYESRFSNL